MPVPNTYNLRAFAERFLHGDCRCAVDGDSINNDGDGGAFYMAYGWVRKISAKWKGITCPPFTGGVAPTLNCTEGSASPVGFGGTLTFGTGGGQVVVNADFWPRKVSRKPDTSPFEFAADQPFFTTFYDFYTDNSLMSVFKNGDWFTNSTNVKARVLYLGVSPSVNLVATDVIRGGTETSTFGIPITKNGRVNYIDIPLNIIGNSNQQCYCKVGGDGNGYDETGQMFLSCGCRLYRTDLVNGLEMAFLAVSGSTVADHNDITKISDNARIDAINALQLNTIIIWLGTNDTVTDIPTWQAAVQTLVNKWFTAFAACNVLDPKICLIMPYAYNDPNKLLLEEQALYNVSLGDSRVSFINLFRLTGGPGSWEINSPLYLADGIHTNAAGALYYAGTIDQAMRASLNNPIIGGIANNDSTKSNDSISFGMAMPTLRL